METMILAIEMVDGLYDTREVAQIWINSDEVATVGITLSQLLTHVKSQGWRFDHSEIRPRSQGVFLTYFYDRPLPLA